MHGAGKRGFAAGVALGLLMLGVLGQRYGSLNLPDVGVWIWNSRDVQYLDCGGDPITYDRGSRLLKCATGAGVVRARAEVTPIAPHSKATVTLAWPTPFPAANAYEALCGVQSGDDVGLSLWRVASVQQAGSITAEVFNRDALSARGGTVRCWASSQPTPTP